MQSNNQLNSLSSIQKPKNKRNVLPKAEVIQLFINNSINGSKSKMKPVLPKFSNNDILNHINIQGTQQLNQNSSESEALNPQNDPGQAANKSSLKKLFKETKKLNYVNLGDNEDCSEFYNNLKNKQNIFKNLANEFFLDCKQRLDTKSYQNLLNLLSEYDTKKDIQIDSQEQRLLLHKIYDLIAHDQNLCNKFSAFLTSEIALEFNLIMENSQYEKTYEFFQKLELMIPNKAAFKKLLQSIISLSNFSIEIDTNMSKIEYLKSKIRAVTKNNVLINFDLDFLFDQRFANLEPIYEKISLVETSDSKETERSSNEEFIDLTYSLSNESNKKCSKNVKTKMNKTSRKN